MPTAAPIIYSFFGTGSGTLGTATFTDAAFTITILTNTSMIYTNPDMYAVPTLQNLCPQVTATVAIAGFPSAIIGFGLTITALNVPKSNLFQLCVGLAPDALIGVANEALKGYALDKSIGPVFGAASFSKQGYPLTTGGNLLFSSMSSAAFQATLALPTDTPPVRPVPGKH
jgi:hypothetical protein